MDQQSQDVLAAFEADIATMRMHGSHAFGQSLKKPLLLLWILSRIEGAKDPENCFHFSQLRNELAELIHEFGGRPSSSGPKPEQPFSHLRSSGFWHLHTQRKYAPGKTVLVSDLNDPETYASLSPDLFQALVDNRPALVKIFNSILDEWWPETVQREIRDRMAMPQWIVRRNARDPRFCPAVLANYGDCCAMCGFHALLDGVPTGVDACHIRWHSARGPDSADNGIALCKLHHWAFDRGFLSLTSDLVVCTSPTLVVRADGGLPIEALRGRKIIMHASTEPPSGAYLEWHRKNIYRGDARDIPR